MALPFERIVTSSVFTFYVGADRAPVNLHNSLISHHSSTLATLMNGEMSEAKAGQVEMPDVDVATFVHFSEWLYSSRYELPYWDGNSQMASKSKEEAERLPWDYNLNIAGRKRREREMRWNGTWDDRVTAVGVGESVPVPVTHNRKQHLWADFVAGTGASFTLPSPPRSNTQRVDVDWLAVLLGHARLHSFADTYGIAMLAEACSNAVRAALIDIEGQKDQIDAFVQLMIYTLENSPSSSLQDTHSLRSTVLDFAVIIFELLIENEDFKDFLRANGDIAVDLLALLCKRLE